MKASSESGLCATLMLRTRSAVAVETELAMGLRTKLRFARQHAVAESSRGQDLRQFGEEKRINPPLGGQVQRRMKRNPQPGNSDRKEQHFSRRRCTECTRESTSSALSDPACEQSDERIGQQVSA